MYKESIAFFLSLSVKNSLFYHDSDIFRCREGLIRLPSGETFQIETPIRNLYMDTVHIKHKQILLSLLTGKLQMSCTKNKINSEAST